MNNLKYLVHLTAPVTTTLDADCHRSEPRVERNILGAALHSGRQVHSTTDIWRTEAPVPPNLHNGLRHDWLHESIMMSYGVNANFYTGYIPDEALTSKYKIAHFHDGPTNETKDNFLKYHYQNPGSVVATCSFRAWTYLSRLKEVLGEENVEWVCGPLVPNTSPLHTPFKQNTLLWVFRNFCNYLNDEKMPALFSKIYDYLNSDPTLKLVIVAQPNNEETNKALQGDCHSWFFTLPFSQILRPYANRVEVKTHLHWHEMFKLLGQTKLVVSPAEPLGCTPFEAGSYGIPMVLEQKTNPFVDQSSTPLFDGVLTAPAGISPQFLDKLDKLFYDESFYNKHGNAYRDFVDQHATYDAYIRKVDEIAAKRGWA